MSQMTKLLEEAIAELVELSEGDQDAAADALFAYMAPRDRRHHLAPEQAAEVRRIQPDLRDGRTRLATDEEIAAVRHKSRRPTWRVVTTFVLWNHRDAASTPRIGAAFKLPDVHLAFGK